MEFTLSTSDIQMLMMCVMFSNVDTLAEKDRERYVDALVDMNNMCSKENNYTLNLTISK